MIQSASVPRLGGPDAMIPDKDEVGGFKPSQAHQVMLGVTFLIMRQSRWLGPSLASWASPLNGDEVRGTWFFGRESLWGYDASAVDDLLARVIPVGDSARELARLGPQARVLIPGSPV